MDIIKIIWIVVVVLIFLFLIWVSTGDNNTPNNNDKNTI